MTEIGLTVQQPVRTLASTDVILPAAMMPRIIEQRPGIATDIMGL